MPNYRPYPAYQPTNIDWLGNIPTHWRVSYLGFECSVKARLGWKGLKAEEYIDEGYVFLATPNIKDNEIDFVNVNRITKERYDESPEIMLEEGDVLVTKDGSTTGTTNIIRYLPEPATVNSSIAVLRRKENLFSHYLYYFFTSPYTQNVINRVRGGMGVPHLFQADLRKFNILLPPKIEQQQIVAFLDRETAKIDQLIAKQQQLIELLKEKRQAVISHAVTKGLNPDVKMKASGVEWLGDVPEHWVVSGFKKYLESIVDYRGKTPTKVDDGIFLVTARNIKNGRIDYTCSQEYVLEDEYASIMSRGLPAIGEVLFTTEAPLGEVAQIDNTEIALAQRIIKFCGKKDTLQNDYLSFYMSSLQFQAGLNIYATGSTALGIKADRLGYLKHLIPPLDEQSKIVSHIKDKNEKFDALMMKAERQIELLRERRAALISAAVTGKIDVREVG